MLDIEKSISAIRHKGAMGEFISYGAVAAASEVAWSATVRSLMPRHLEAVCARMLPEANALISAIVVNETNLRSGKLEDHAFVGFLACAARLGFAPIADREKFLREQQQLTIAWARKSVLA